MTYKGTKRCYVDNKGNLSHIRQNWFLITTETTLEDNADCAVELHGPFIYLAKMSLC